MADVYALERGRNDVNYSSQSYLRGGWLYIAIRASEINFQLMPRMRKKIRVGVPERFSLNIIYYLVIGDKTLDPPIYHLIEPANLAYMDIVI